MAQPQLPRVTQGLVALGGRIGAEPEDFRVDEVPAYAFSGEGQHRFVKVQKRLRTTQELVKAVARAAGISPREVGFAGMKDKQGVTSQWLSFLDRGTKPVETWELPPEYTVLESTLHNNKLRTGHLLGNRFCIRLVGLACPDTAVVDALLRRLREVGLYNFFGEQRFGHDGKNWESALKWVEQERLDRRNRFENKLYPSVIQSMLFNRYLARRIEIGLSTLMEGEVVRLHGTGSHFTVGDVAAEQPRLDARDLWLTGPMFGPKMKPSAAAVRALEEELIASAGLSESAWQRLATLAPGTRRDLIVPLLDLECELLPDSCCRLTFSLPAGGYATRVITELTHGDARQEPSASAVSTAATVTGP